MFWQQRLGPVALPGALEPPAQPHGCPAAPPACACLTQTSPRPRRGTPRGHRGMRPPKTATTRVAQPEHPAAGPLSHQLCCGAASAVPSSARTPAQRWARLGFSSHHRALLWEDSVHLRMLINQSNCVTLSKTSFLQSFTPKTLALLNPNPVINSLLPGHGQRPRGPGRTVLVPSPFPAASPASCTTSGAETPCRHLFSVTPPERGPGSSRNPQRLCSGRHSRSSLTPSPPVQLPFATQTRCPSPRSQGHRESPGLVGHEGRNATRLSCALMVQPSRGRDVPGKWSSLPRKSPSWAAESLGGTCSQENG